LSECVKFLGYVRGPNKVDALENNDIYCFPSYFGEGMPNSVLEALAFGMPVITCCVGGLTDISPKNWFVRQEEMYEIF